MAYVYILQSLKNNKFYIGSTNNIERRIKEHQSGSSKYTKSMLPVKLVFTQEYLTTQEARNIEFWLKKQKDVRLIKRILTEAQITKSSS